MKKSSTASSMSLGFMGILKQSLKIPLRNPKLAISLAVLLIVPSTLLYLCDCVMLNTFVMEIAIKSYKLRRREKGSPEYIDLKEGIKDDIRIIMGGEAIYTLAATILSLITSISAVYGCAAAYCGKELSLRNLCWTVGRRWERPLITWLYIVLFKTGYLLLLAISIDFLAFVVAKGSASLVGLIILIALLGLLFYHYLSVVWKLGFVISVVEENLYGVGALGKAGELIKGRKLQGFGLYLVPTLPTMSIITTWVYFLQMRNNIGHSEGTGLVVGVIAVNLVSLISLCVDAITTVFYYECKQNHGEVEELQSSLGYIMVPTSTHVDEAVP